MNCERWDVVVVPFPFAERAGKKRRPALVLSATAFNAAGHTVMAMITTQGHHPWPGDCPVRDSVCAGLPSPCMIRLKLFTLDNRLIVRRLGSLGAPDRDAVHDAVKAYIFAAESKAL